MSVAKGNDPCTIEGCKDKVNASGLCIKHYSRKRKNGSTDTPKRRGEQPIDKTPAYVALGTRLWNASLFEVSQGLS